jgi:hypothetical protein
MSEPGTTTERPSFCRGEFCRVVLAEQRANNAWNMGMDSDAIDKAERELMFAKMVLPMCCMLADKVDFTATEVTIKSSTASEVRGTEG